jgi:trehalose/maltose transport system substrate-binding protein
VTFKVLNGSSDGKTAVADLQKRLERTKGKDWH